MNAHVSITDLFVSMSGRWTDACEVLASVREATEKGPPRIRSEIPEMLSKLDSAEHDAMAIIALIREAKALLIEAQQLDTAKAIDVLANLESNNAA